MKKRITESQLRAAIMEALADIQAPPQEELTPDGVDTGVKTENPSQEPSEKYAEEQGQDPQVQLALKKIDMNGEKLFNGYDCINAQFLHNFAIMFPGFMECIEVAYHLDNRNMITPNEPLIGDSRNLVLRYYNTSLGFKQNDEEGKTVFVILIIKVGVVGAGAGAASGATPKSNDEEDRSNWAKTPEEAFRDIKPITKPGVGWIQGAIDAKWSKAKIAWYKEIFRKWRDAKKNAGTPKKDSISAKTDNNPFIMKGAVTKGISKQIDEMFKMRKNKTVLDVPDNMVKKGYINQMPRVGEQIMPLTGRTVTGKTVYANYYPNKNYVDGWYLQAAH